MLKQNFCRIKKTKSISKGLRHHQPKEHFFVTLNPCFNVRNAWFIVRNAGWIPPVKQVNKTFFKKSKANIGNVIYSVIKQLFIV